jgi:hypothetical protein
LPPSPFLFFTLNLAYRPVTHAPRRRRLLAILDNFALSLRVQSFSRSPLTEKPFVSGRQRATNVHTRLIAVFHPKALYLTTNAVADVLHDLSFASVECLDEFDIV